VQLEKAPDAIAVSPSLSVRFFRFLQPPNAESPILATFLPIATVSKESQLRKAAASTTVTVSVKTVTWAGGTDAEIVNMVEAADDICYEIMDIEDSHKLKILTFEETEELLLAFFDEDTQRKMRQRIMDEGITDENEKVVYMRACVIGKLEHECVATFLEHEEEILQGTFKGSLIDQIPERQREAYKKCEKVSFAKIYHSKPVLDIELSGYKIMATLMEVFVDAAMNPTRFYSQQLIRRVSSQYDINNPDLEERIMAVIDYISGMTDIYALDIYQKINGISLPIV